MDFPFSGLFNMIGNGLTAYGNYKAQESANQVNREIANQNIAFQQRENEITRMREDNAIQRSASDMASAGLSKTLAAGNPASSQALTAPQNNYQYQSPMAKALEKLNLVQAYLNAESLQGDINQKKASADLLQSQAEGQQLANGTFMEKFANEQSYTIARTEATKAQMSLWNAQENLARLEGDTFMENFKTKVDNLIADTRNKNLTYHEIEWKINNLVADYSNTSEKTKLLLKDIAYKSLEIEGMKHDLAYARKYNLPLHQQVPGLAGTVLNSGRSFGKELSDFILSGFNKGFNFIKSFVTNNNNEAELWDMINNS